jgi:hypothetical protein
MHRMQNNSRRRILNVQTGNARLSTADRPDALVIRSCKERLENIDKDERYDRGGCADATAKRQIIGHCGSIDNMPKQSKNKATASETERRRAEILHNRRVKEILEENERKRTPFDRWSRRGGPKLDMNFPSGRTHRTYFNQRLRSGLIIHNDEGHPRFAIRRPRGGVESDPSTIESLRRGHLVYVPEGFFGAEVGGSGKPKKKAGKAKRS